MPSVDLVAVKKEVEPVEEGRPEESAKMEEDTVEQPLEESSEGSERVEPGIMGGLGLLCDVAHRFIEEEAAASRPQSPCEDSDKKSTGSQSVLHFIILY